ncbi:MAG: hypothetical protein PVH61_11960 [Candidatus Aminicenantes bacterium]|jgi:hypothetical protein
MEEYSEARKEIKLWRGLRTRSIPGHDGMTSDAGFLSAVTVKWAIGGGFGRVVFVQKKNGKNVMKFSKYFEMTVGLNKNQ